MVFTKSCELWLCIFDIKPKLAKPFCLGSSEKNSKQGYPLCHPMFSNMFSLSFDGHNLGCFTTLCHLCILVCQQGFSIHGSVFARLSIFWIIKLSFWGMLRTTPKHICWFYILWYPHDILEKGLACTPYKGFQIMEDGCRSPSRHPTCIDRPQSKPAAISCLYNQLVEIPSNAAYENLKYIKFQSITVYL